jgi:hypothetical protein
MDDYKAVFDEVDKAVEEHEQQEMQDAKNREMVACIGFLLFCAVVASAIFLIIRSVLNG